MAAKIFEIIGLIAILIFVPVFILLLRFLGRSLKRANKSLGARRSEIRGNLSSTIKGLDSAQGQIDALSGTPVKLKKKKKKPTPVPPPSWEQKRDKE
jgi:hypothetical protein